MNTLKSVITTDTKSLNTDGVLHVQLSGSHLTALKAFINKRKKKPGSVLYFDLVDEESKSTKQNNTFHDLIKIYWKSGNAPSDHGYDELRERIKRTYGVCKTINIYNPDIDSYEPYLFTKSWSKYTLSEGREAIDGLIDEMLVNGVNDKRFLEMIDEWNSGTVEPVEKMELF